MSLDGSSQASLVTLITFSYGANFATVARYTSATTPLVDGVNTFAAEPSIEVTMNAQPGGAQDVPVQVRMLAKTPLDTLTSQRAHSAVRVLLEEADPTNLSDRRTLFAGLISLSTRNPDGKTGIVEIEVSGWRAALAISTNCWIADTTCNNVFGDPVCGKDLSSIQETATVSAIDGNVVTLTGLTTTGTPGYWRFGFLAVDGLQIMIRDYTTGNQVTLLKTPPAAWMGAAVTATPGCDKQLTSCRTWGRETRFTGIGMKIPAYNPLLESN